MKLFHILSFVTFIILICVCIYVSKDKIEKFMLCKPYPNSSSKIDCNMYNNIKINKNEFCPNECIKIQNESKFNECLKTNDENRCLDILLSQKWNIN